MQPLKFNLISTSSSIEKQIVIAGAGPSGVSTSLFLSKQKIPHLIIDKAKFPRDKICGDAISGKVLDTLTKYDPAFVKEHFEGRENLLPAFGITFYAPNGKNVDIGFPSSATDSPGYISRRLHFDQLIFDHLDTEFAEIWQKAELLDAVQKTEGITLTVRHNGIQKQVNTSLAIAAEGSRSVIAKQVGGTTVEEKHYCAGIRAYYSGVEGMHPQNYLELHFINELLPGYFWIFPLPGGSCNVGMGMLSSKVSQKKVNLRKELLRLVTEHPVLKQRFKNARPEGKIQGWGLPLGSKKRSLSGSNYLLTGDSGYLIDPFTGEGIGNAFVSGMLAAKVAAEAIAANDFSARHLFGYDTMVYTKLWDELKLSRTLQQLSAVPPLFNFVVNKISGSESLQEVFTTMYNDVEVRAQMKNPLFYFRLLFN
ncbi:MAG: geranylgeranyl reductase family protein [Bacteroidia bacterium]